MSHVPQSFAPGAVLAPSPRVRVREIAGEAVLVDLASGTYFALNDVATVIWERLAAAATLGAAHAAVVEQFEVEPERAWSDLVDLVRELLAQGLVTVTVADPDADD